MRCLKGWSFAKSKHFSGEMLGDYLIKYKLLITAGACCKLFFGGDEIALNTKSAKILYDQHYWDGKEWTVTKFKSLKSSITSQWWEFFSESKSENHLQRQSPKHAEDAWFRIQFFILLHQQHTELPFRLTLSLNCSILQFQCSWFWKFIGLVTGQAALTPQSPCPPAVSPPPPTWLMWGLQQRQVAAPASSPLPFSFHSSPALPPSAAWCTDTRSSSSSSFACLPQNGGWDLRTQHHETLVSPHKVNILFFLMGIFW